MLPRLEAIFILFACLVQWPTAIAASSLCTPETAIQRKEWSEMTVSERTAYIAGVKCVQSLPSRYDEGIVPASTSLYDDFTAVHVNLTMSIHVSGIFLSWHRHFLHLFEAVLHDQCAYPPRLGIPYWDWPRYIDSDPASNNSILESSPLFDGTSTSLGSNGMYDPSQGPYTIGPGLTAPHGTGGSCVTTGPFANTTLRFGPFATTLVSAGGASAAEPAWTSPRPHCLTRDLNAWALRRYCNASAVSALLAADTITTLQGVLNSVALGGDRGLHGGGHMAIGGTMFDFFASPQDPAFFLHHGQIDRLWATWQAGGANRRWTYNGTATIFNGASTPEVSNGTVLDFGVLGGPRTAEEVANPKAGDYCYVYV